MAASNRRPRISLVVPTRDRAFTLAQTLRTCVAQDYPELEIVVHDNASGPDTAETVARFDDPRLRYFRSDTRLSMRANWEAALARTTGDYIVYIGDDDLVTLGGISRLAGLIAETGAEAIKWTSVNYIWPNRSTTEGGYLILKHSKLFWDYTVYGGRAILDAMFEGRLRMSMRTFHVYHGCISRRIIEDVKASTKQYFCYQIPDVYTAFANVFVTDRILFVRHPITSFGHSASSNAMSFYQDATKAVEAGGETPYAKFVSEIDADREAPWPYNPFIKAMSYHGLVSLHIANEMFATGRTINVEAWLGHALAETVADPVYLAEAHKAPVVYDFDRMLKERLPPAPATAVSAHGTRIRAHGTRRRLNKLDVPTALDGEDNSFTAARVLERLTDTGYRIAPRGPLSTARHAWHWLRLQARAGEYLG